MRNDVANSDIAGIAVVSGVLTASGGRTSHAAVVARLMGKVCLVGCADLRIDENAKQATLGPTRIAEGDLLCLDCDAGTIYSDSPKITIERPEALIDRVRKWNQCVSLFPRQEGIGFCSKTRWSWPLPWPSPHGQ